MNEKFGKIDPRKAYAIRITSEEVEIYREFDTMKEAERLWRDPRYRIKKDFATTTGTFLISLLEKRRLVSSKTST